MGGAQVLLLSLLLVIGVIGSSAVTLAQRKRVPCTACKRGELVVDHDFARRCTTCGARFRPVQGALHRIDE